MNVTVDDSMINTEDIPDQMTRRYDRQLRLWNKSGQASLGSSHILLLGVTSTGSEVLKNMILAGIQKFTIIDDSWDREGSGNFFLNRDQEDQIKRGEANMRLLQELNPQVEGRFLDFNPVTVLSQNQSFFDEYSAVIVSMSLQFNEVFIKQLSEILWSRDIPLITIDTSGFIGYFRFSHQEHPVVETHPETFNDLRLDSPITGLLEWVESIDFDAADAEFGNIPYVAILIRYIRKWAEEKGDPTAFPSTYQQKKELKALIHAGKRSSDQENFEEAITAVNSVVQSRKVPSTIIDIFNNVKCNKINDQTPIFWLMARALREFYYNSNQGKEQYLPLSGAIPDMKSDSERYIALQKIYKDQAQKDSQAVFDHLQTLKPLAPQVESISLDQVSTFCKNSYHLHVSDSIPIHEEWSKTVVLDDLKNEDSSLWFWLVFRARHYVASTSNKILGSGSSDFNKDLNLLLNTTSLIPSGLEISEPSPKAKKFMEQILTGPSSELATTASILGGLIAQELTKLFTQQYVPSKSTCIFNGLESTALPIEIQIKRD